MSITGSTQAFSVVLSIVRIKVLALLLGPAGVGILSLYNSFQNTAATIAGLGIASSGVRQIAQARDDENELSRVRRVLLAANLVQGALAMAASWLLRAPIAHWLFGRPGYEREVGLVGVAVFLTLVAASQTALLRGMRRIGDLGRVTVLGALAGTIGGIAAVWTLGTDGLLWFVVLQPLTAVAVAAYFTRKLPESEQVGVRRLAIWRVWKPMVLLGAGFMVANLATTGTLLVVRGKIASDLGLDAAGEFAAAWGLTSTYVGFLLNAMAMDYYPRLAEIIHDRPAATRLMNEQMQIGLALGGPVVLLMIGLAPAAIAILYSAKFGGAVAVLQWQAAGDVFKIASWALSFSVVAAARSKSYILLEASFLAPYGLLIYLLLPSIGLEITGAAYLLSYVVYFAVAHGFAAKIARFRMEPLSAKLLVGYAGGAVVLLALSLANALTGAVAAVVLFAGTGFIGGHIVLQKIGPHRYTAPFARLYAACGWPLWEAA